MCQFCKIQIAANPNSIPNCPQTRNLKDQDVADFLSGFSTFGKFN